MPTYRFQRGKKEWEEFMTISQLDAYLKENPDVVQLVNGAPRIVSGIGPLGLGRNKVPDQDFRDLLKNIKKNNKGATFDIK